MFSIRLALGETVWTLGHVSGTLTPRNRKNFSRTGKVEGVVIVDIESQANMRKYVCSACTELAVEIAGVNGTRYSVHLGTRRRTRRAQ